MSKAAKIWLIVAGSLVLAGAAIFICMLSLMGWRFEGFSTTKYETNSHEITEEFDSVSISTDTAKVTLIPTDGDKCYIECYEQENASHTVAVREGTLFVELNDTRKWYEHIGIGYSSPKVSVYIPRGEYGELCVSSHTGNIDIPDAFKFKSIGITASTGDVNNRASAYETVRIKTTTGGITVENITAAALELSVSTGNIMVTNTRCDGNITVDVSTGKTHLTRVSCNSFISSGSTGTVYLTDVIASDRFSIERSTGDVILESCDAYEIAIKTDTGDVEGSLLSEKIFITNTDTGDIDVPRGTSGGVCEITTDTGDIRIYIK